MLCRFCFISRGTGNVLLSIPGKAGWGWDAEGFDTLLIYKVLQTAKKTLKGELPLILSGYRTDQEQEPLGSSRSFGCRCEMLPTFPILGLLRCPRRQQDLATCPSLSQEVAGAATGVTETHISCFLGHYQRAKFSL